MCTACVYRSAFHTSRRCRGRRRSLQRDTAAPARGPSYKYIHNHTHTHIHSVMLRSWEQTDRICLRKEKKEKPIQFICLLTGRLLHISFARQTAEHELTNCGIRSGSTPPPLNLSSYLIESGLLLTLLRVVHAELLLPNYPSGQDVDISAGTWQLRGS